MRTRLSLLAAFACLAIAQPASAQELARARSLTLDNDYFAFWLPPRQRSDDNYTHGIRASFDLRRPFSVARKLVCATDRACGSTIEIGQEMYTPTYDGSDPVPDERSYAGLLYGKARVNGATASRSRSIELTVGITGPASLAELSQSLIHKIAPQFRQPLGWGHQLPTEPVFAVRGAQAWRVAPSGPAAHVVDLLPSADATVGTLRTSLAGGARVRLGTGLPHPWLADGGRRFTLFAFAGARGEAVARDLFLDGTTFQNSIRVGRKPLVAEWERGFRIGVSSLALEYRAVTRGREYISGPRKQTFASMGVHWLMN